MSEVHAALNRATSAVGDRWSLLVVAALMDGPRRFGEIQEAVPGVAPNILTSRLRHLERQGVLVTRPYSQRPVRLEYRLTARGTELAGAIRLLTAWEADAGEGGGEAGGATADGQGTVGLPRHQSCGTTMELRWWCPTCGLAVEQEEAEDHWV
ncbi:MAG TPA: helix-turn-helix domain-containing protein [Acidimicrobiales bacterium]|nr:helix-turn-helix domain-containing protein [Acidimicrobiales bacterium]